VLAGCRASASVPQNAPVVAAKHSRAFVLASYDLAQPGGISALLHATSAPRASETCRLRPPSVGRLWRQGAGPKAAGAAWGHAAISGKTLHVVLTEATTAHRLWLRDEDAAAARTGGVRYHTAAAVWAT
jgi:hypothetical protein